MERDDGLKLLDALPHEDKFTAGRAGSEVPVHETGNGKLYMSDDCPWCKLKTWIESITIMVD